jgi:putative DNA primase/helicase
VTEAQAEVGVDPAASREAVAMTLRAVAPKTYHRTDVGNGERLVDLHGDEPRFRFERSASGVWHVWNGKQWAEDRSGEVERRAKATVAAMYADASKLSGDDRETLGKWATACESVSKLKAMVEAARSDVRVVIALEDLDADPWSLNVDNGIIDLKTGSLRPHDPAELHTRIAPASLIDEDWREQAPTWATFVERVLPDYEVRSYVQKLAGYTLAGDVGENVAGSLGRHRALPRGGLGAARGGRGGDAGVQEGEQPAGRVVRGEVREGRGRVRLGRRDSGIATSAMSLSSASQRASAGQRD